MFRIVIMLILVMNIDAQNDWTYENQFSWRILNPICGGVKQSPIDISTENVKINPFVNLEFKGYDRHLKHAMAHNNGHTVAITLSKLSDRPFIVGEAVNGEKYNFQELHAHWGNDDFDGSEHLINDKKFSAELHFVHYNSNYKSFTRARDERNGLVVVSVLLRVSRHDNPALSPLTDILHRIRHLNSSTEFDSRLILEKLLPINRLVFRYYGSLTTPPCSETVIWFIFAHPIKISPHQLHKFRELRGEDGPILTNYRQLQPINSRKIELEKSDNIFK